MVMQVAAGSADVAPFHNRQPVLLDEAAAASWLNLAADGMAVVRPPPPGTYVADPKRPDQLLF